MDISWLPLAAFIITAAGWITREVWRWIIANRQEEHEKMELLKFAMEIIITRIREETDPDVIQKLDTKLKDLDDALIDMTNKTFKTSRRT